MSEQCECKMCGIYVRSGPILCAGCLHKKQEQLAMAMKRIRELKDELFQCQSELAKFKMGK